MHWSVVAVSVKNRLIELLKKHQFDVALPLLSLMKETWPSDAIFTAAAVTDETSDDSSMSTDEDSARVVANLLGYLQQVFLGKQLLCMSLVLLSAVSDDCCVLDELFICVCLTYKKRCRVLSLL